jgi:hypothetical protein
MNDAARWSQRWSQVRRYTQGREGTSRDQDLDSRIREGTGRDDKGRQGTATARLRTARQGVRFPPGAPGANTISGLCGRVRAQIGTQLAPDGPYQRLICAPVTAPVEFHRLIWPLPPSGRSSMSTVSGLQATSGPPPGCGLARRRSGACSGVSGGGRDSA